MHFPHAEQNNIYGKRSIAFFMHLEGRLLSRKKLFEEGRLIEKDDREALKKLAEKVGLPPEEVVSDFTLNLFLSKARKILKKKLKGKKP